MLRPDGLRRSAKIPNGADAGRKGYAAGIEQCKSDSRFCSKSCAGDGTGKTGVERITIAGQSYIIAKQIITQSHC